MLENPEFIKQSKLTPGFKDKTVIVQGYGSVGYNSAKFLAENGATVVGIITQDSALYNSAGFDVDDVKKYYTEHKTLKDYPKTQKQGKKNIKSY